MAAISRRTNELLVFLYGILVQYIIVIFLSANLFPSQDGQERRKRRDRIRYKMATRLTKQIQYLKGVVEVSDVTCVNHLRMNRNSFAYLLYLLENVGGLKHSRYTTIRDKAAMFLLVLAHHTKNRVLQQNFSKSGETVSKYFHEVLNAVLKLHRILILPPKPVEAENTEQRWRWFKGCLGALDGTHVKVTVREHDKARYRNRKGDISVNILGASDRNMNFTYILAGWEGSAADSRVVRDAISRPQGLKIPKGSYYLCDSGYMNAEGFLAPYRGVRYHLDAWGIGRNSPQNSKEYFNMIHARARNVIERSFGLLKKRWAILRSPSFFPIKSQNRIIMACCLLQNYIRKEMPYDPEESSDEIFGNVVDEHELVGDDDDHVTNIGCSDEWAAFRDNLAQSAYIDWKNSM